MNIQSDSFYSALKTRNTVVVFCILAITIWIAYFWNFEQFGLYSDDYNLVAIPACPEVSLLEYIHKMFLDLVQGRPICFSLIALFSHLGFKLGGIKYIYLFSYSISFLNSCLFYLLLQRLINNNYFSFIGSLVFPLFPADTTRAYLTHIGVYPSLTFLLIAFHLYLSNKKKSSYLPATLMLLTYETAFPVFFIAPLINNKWDRKSVKELMKHICILVIILASIVFIRKIKGEVRISNFQFKTVIISSIYNMLIGPLITMKMFLYRPFQVLTTFNDAHSIFLFAFLTILFFILLSKVSRSDYDFSFSTKKIIKLFFLGTLMLILSYSFAITVPAYAINSIYSRVHLSACLGGAIIFACMSTAVLRIAESFKQQIIVNILLAGLFSLLIGFGFIIQKDFVKSWDYQRQFWTDFIRLCPDLDNDSIVFINSEGFSPTKQITTLDWAVSRGLMHIYKLQDNYKNLADDFHKMKPLVFLLLPKWQKYFIVDGNIFQLKTKAVWTFRPINTKFDFKNLIFLEIKDGKIVSRKEKITINNKEYKLKKTSRSNIKTFEKGYLYSYLIK